ncbi:PAS domain S-box protein [Pseudotabrizicola sp. 4114]|uniref:PAS domain S-box protein n=1 Tax=Pseudotabrizicola sp. 4114 TaxID=2817731 RepID=UPI0028547F1D|nr:PAS domain S-box-containing protein [Pseudorhodobacter sp. 4114]
MDGNSLSVTDAGALLLVIPEVLAGLAEAGLSDYRPAAIEEAVQNALNQLSGALSVPLRLQIGERVWQTGQPGPGQIIHSGGCLEGVPQTLSAPVHKALESGLRAVIALYHTAAKASVRQAQAAWVASRITRRDQLLRRLFDLSPVGVVLIDFESGTILEANTAFMDFGDWSRESLVGVNIRSILHPDHALAISQAVAELDEGGRFGPFDQRFICPDGSGFPAILRGLLLTGGEGQKIVWLMVEDVSELRAHLAEVQAVRDEAVRARAELHTAVQALPHGFMLCDAEGRIVMVNTQMVNMYPELAPLMVPGSRYEDLLRAGLKIGLWPATPGQEEDLIKEVMARRREPFIEKLSELQDGRVIRILDRLTPTGGRVGLRIDVTAERDNERRLSQVIDGSQAGTWECDFLTWENRVNARWAEMLGWTCEELAPINLGTWQALLHPDDLEPTMACVARVAQGETDRFDVVFRLRHRAGHWVWVQSRGQVSLRNADGLPVRMSGVHVDVSALKAAEQRLEQIIEGAEAGIWHHDMLAGICHVNELWVRMLGYTLEELGPVTDEVWQGLLHPDDWRMLNCNMQARMASGSNQFQDELRLRHKDGHWVWVASRGHITAWDAQGNVTATSGVHLDISARKKLEGDLEAERDFLATLTETSGSGILAVDEDARIVFFNREVQRIFELPGEALLNQVCDSELLRLTDCDGQPLPFSGLPCRVALSEGQAVRDLRLCIAMADGREKVLSVNAAELPDPGMTARVVCTITDITAAAQAENDLRAAIDRAEAANRAKSQFLANMSHELRTPLNGVLGMAELLAGGTLDPGQRTMLNAIRESGVHLLSVVNDLLDLAKIESGKLVLDPAPVNVRELAERIDAMHGLAARRKEVDLRVTLGPGADRLRMGDAKRLLQVLHNLVGNAVKFTEAGSVEVTICEHATSDGQLVIVVSDTGIGMSGDQTARVFEEFTQGDDSITRRFGGTGLGLPIVRRLVALMEGEIALVSAFGQGTTVTVTLPMPLVAVQDAVADRSDEPQTDGQLAGLNALLAEDNPTNRLIMRAMLMRLGISVMLVCDGDEAVEMWAPGRFDLVLLDISMPRKDGLSALAELREKAGRDGLPPVLAVTANAMAQHLQEYHEAGFAEVITKPVTLEALTQAIHRARRAVSPLPALSSHQPLRL